MVTAGESELLGNGDIVSPLEDDEKVHFSKEDKGESLDHMVGSSSEGLKDESARDSPAIQMMERDGDYDPNRIPSSVFARSDSVASNESLFSLQVGISFGRDQAVLSALESHQLREMYSTASAAKIDELKSNAEATDSKAAAKESQLAEVKEHPCEEEEPKPPSAVAHSSVSGRSDGSEGSNFSFAFPILAPGRGQSSSTKGDASSSQTVSSRGKHSGHDTSNPTGTPQQPPPPIAKTGYFSCFSCPSCCSFPSSCSRPSCSSCWPFRS